MKNTGIVYISDEKTPVVLPELANLLPPLSAEQLERLEADIMENGCYSPVIVTENLELVDGHNRKALCEKHGIPYNMVVFRFDSKLDAMEWAVNTQKGRRNLSNWELGQIALKLKPELRAKARANMSAAGGDRKSRNRAEEKPGSGIVHVDTRRDMAASVGISPDTMGHIMIIDEKAPQAVKDALDRKEISIHAGYQITRQVQNLPEGEREQAARTALESRKLKNKGIKTAPESDSRDEIARAFTKALAQNPCLRPTQENVRCWVENSGMDEKAVKRAVRKAHRLSEMYVSIEWTLRTLYPEAGSGRREPSDNG